MNTTRVQADTNLDNSIDVIVQYDKNGKVIPMRIRIQDEDGIYHSYTVHQYRELNPSNQYTMPNHITVSSKFKHYEIKVVVFGIEKKLPLFFNGEKWYLK